MTIYLNQPAADWTDKHFEQWARGEAKAGNKVTDESIIEVVKAKYPAVEVTTIDQAREAVLGKPPVEEQSNEQPEVPEPVTPTPEEPSDLPVEQVTTPAPAAAASTPALDVLRANLADYAAVMRPGRAHKAGEGETAQRGLWRSIQSVLDQKGPAFFAGWTELLKFAHEQERASFGMKYLYRYFDSSELLLSKADVKTFLRLLNLISATANPATRSLGLSQVDLKTTVATLANTNQQQLVESFYTV